MCVLASAFRSIGDCAWHASWNVYIYILGLCVGQALCMHGLCVLC